MGFLTPFLSESVFLIYVLASSQPEQDRAKLLGKSIHEESAAKISVGDSVSDAVPS